MTAAVSDADYTKNMKDGVFGQMKLYRNHKLISAKSARLNDLNFPPEGITPPIEAGSEYDPFYKEDEL